MRYDSLRVLLAHITQEDLEMATFDVRTAFLYGELEEVIHMEIPEGVKIHEGEENSAVCVLRKSLYGLKQAPRCWNVRFKKFLCKFNLRECNADKCIFVGKFEGYKIYLALFVDDGLLACKSFEIIKNILVELSNEFSITTGDASYFVGLQITRNRSEFVH